MGKQGYESVAPRIDVSTNLPTTDRRRKSVLFCPECGHESTATGDWVVSERDGRTDYDCPDCGATVTTRTVPGTGHRDRSAVETPADD